MSLQEIPLGEICEPVSRPVPVEPGVQYRTIGVKLWGKGAYERETIDGFQTRAKTLYAVKEGDLIINKIWVRHGSTAIATAAVDGCAASGEFPMFRLNLDRIVPRWMHWQTKTRKFWGKCAALSQGTSGKNRIKPALFLNIKIPLPVLSEQRRIVARLEALAAKVEMARGLQQQAAKGAEVLSGSGAVKAFRALDEANTLPIKKIAEVRGGLQKSPKRIPLNYPVRYLTVAHVQRNSILLSDPRYFEMPPDELEQRRLRSGDVLIIEGNGSADQIGRTAVFRGEIEPCVHQNHVICIRPDQDKIDSEYLNVFLNSPVGRDKVKSQSRTTSGLLSLSMGRIKEIHIPVPSLSEQRRIVAYLDDLQAKVDSLKDLQAETAAELDALLPSILDKAFKGKL